MKGKDIGNICLNCGEAIIEGYRSRGINKKRFHKGCLKAFKAKTERIFCGCGCKTLIFPLDQHGLSVKFVPGHNRGYKGHKREMKEGYIEIKIPDYRFVRKSGWIPEHRVIWENANNATLLPWANVHHKNGDKHDNKPENLDAMMNKQHSRLHSEIRRDPITGRFL